MQQENRNEEQDNIYADLDSSILFHTQQRKKLKSDGCTITQEPLHPKQDSKAVDESYPSSSFHTQSTKSSDLFTSMQQDIERLQKTLNEYQTENEILKQNMGTLYRTAKLELDRKNRRIEELERMVEQQKVD